MEGFCRGCLLQYNEPTDLLQYTEKNRRMFVYSTGLQVKRNDSFTFQVCKDCYFNMKLSCKFKKQCRTSENKFRSYLMLKEDGEDFGNFLKIMDEKGSFRLPLTSGHSTPAHHKNRDDDNESTCTSIRNFMTDILDTEEMAPTEARIIREVIEEEADVLDDSLDSYWLQDDRSVGSDFDVDFGFTPFGTPRSVQNNECYTPRKILEAKQREINYLTSEEIIENLDKPKIEQKFDMPLIEDMVLNNIDNMAVKRIKDECTEDDKDSIKKPVPPNMSEFDNSIPSEVEDMVTENSISSTLECFKTDLLKDLAVKKQMDILLNDNSNFTFDEIEHVTAETNVASEKVTDSESKDSVKDICIVLNQGISGKSLDVPLASELDYYVNKADLKKQITTTKDKEEYHCTIDRNLAIALKNAGSNEFSLDQLIITPSASIRSGVSTPTINSILFGDKNTETETNPTLTPTIKNILFEEKLNTESAPKYFPQVGQSIENMEDDESDINILEDFLKPNANNNKINDGCSIKTELEDSFDPDFEHDLSVPKEETYDEIKSEDHVKVLEQFLQGSKDEPSILNEKVIGQIIDPLELADQDLFKRPRTPPYDKYDLDKNLCKICDRNFNSAKCLKIHFAKSHEFKIPTSDPHRNKSQNSKIKMCDICGKDVKGAANYSRHMRRHRDQLIEYFECDVCTMFFKSRPALLVHMRSHNNTTPIKKKKEYICDTCGRVNFTSSHHKLHIRRHLKQISVSCDICQKGFYRTHDLQQHVRLMHYGERAFECQHCNKSYKRRDALHQHMKRHLGKFEYKCETCNLEFISKSILAQHYGSKKCIMKRELSMKLNENVTIAPGKGSNGSTTCVMKRELSKKLNENVTITPGKGSNGSTTCAMKRELSKKLNENVTSGKGSVEHIKKIMKCEDSVLFFYDSDMENEN